MVRRRRRRSLLIPMCPFAQLPLSALWRCGSAHSTEAAPPLIEFDGQHELLILPQPPWCNVALERISQAATKLGRCCCCWRPPIAFFFIMFFSLSFCSLFHFGVFHFIYLFIYFWCCKHSQKPSSVSFLSSPLICFHAAAFSEVVWGERKKRYSVF